MSWRIFTENLATDLELSRQSLETTRMFAGCWLLALEKWRDKRINAIEFMVEDAAQFDWGPETTVIFEPENKRIIVIEGNRIAGLDDVPAVIRKEFSERFENGRAYTG